MTHLPNDQQRVLESFPVMVLDSADPLQRPVPLSVGGRGDGRALWLPLIDLMIYAAFRVAPATQRVVFLSTVEGVTRQVHIFNDALRIVPNGSRGTLGNEPQRAQSVGGKPFKASFLRHADGAGPLGKIMGDIASRRPGNDQAPARSDGAVFEKIAEA